MSLDIKLWYIKPINVWQLCVLHDQIFMHWTRSQMSINTLFNSVKTIWIQYLQGTNVTNINVSIPDLKNIYFNDRCNLSFNFILEMKNNTWSKGKWKSILNVRNCRHAYVFISDCLTVNYKYNSGIFIWLISVLKL